MIDQELIHELDEPTRSDVRTAVRLLAESGVIDLQMQRELARLAAGAVNEDEAKLGGRVVDYRRKHSSLLALKELGENIAKEQNNE